MRYAFKKIDTIKKFVESMVTEKELFLNISKSFNSYNFIDTDDLERMNGGIKIEDVFGIIDELKRCNYVKVIVVAICGLYKRHKIYMMMLGSN